MEPLKLRISLRAARINANLTLIEAAQRLGVNKSTLLNWEKHSGKVTAINQARLSDLYKIPIDNIFFGF